jgi:hypothetical protein
MTSKADHTLALKVVRGIIHEWDPYSLLAGGAPADEFDSEIASVVKQIPRIKSQQDAALAISRVFSSAFEKERFTPNDCAAIGTKLYDALLQHRLVPTE